MSEVRSTTRTKEIFVAAVELSKADRAALLDRMCFAAPELRAEVEALLEHDEAFEAITPEEAARAANVENQICIGGCVLQRVIGEGGQAIVYEALQEHPRRRVAVKLLRGLWANAGSLRRFEREAEILAALEHPGIARLYASGIAPSAGGHPAAPYLVMEFVEGTNVLQWAKETKADAKAIVRMMQSVCAAVEHAHRHGFLHRDLSPANILVSLEGTARILDFGIARVFRESGGNAVTITGNSVGTPRYASPEQVHGKVKPDTRADVYSLGVVLGDLIEQTERGEGRRTSSLRAIAQKAAATAADSRYQSVRELHADLNRWMEGRPVLATATSPVRVAMMFMARNRAWTIAAVIALMLLGAAVGSITEAERRARENLEAACDASAAYLRTTVLALSKYSGTREARRVLADAALREATALESLQPSDVSIQAIIAEALDAVSDVMLEDGRADECVVVRDQAVAIRRRLDDGTAESLRLLAYALIKRGDVEGAVGALRRDAATRAQYIEAMALQERAVKLDPASLAALDDLGWSYDRFEESANRLGRPDEALIWSQKRFDTAILRRKLRDDATANHSMCRAWHLRAETLAAAERVDEALESIARGREEAEKLLKRDPTNRLFRHEAALIYSQTSYLLGSKNSDESRASRARAYELCQQNLKDDPNDYYMLVATLGVCQQAAAGEEKLADPHATIQWAERGLAIAEQGEKLRPGDITILHLKETLEKQRRDAEAVMNAEK